MREYFERKDEHESETEGETDRMRAKTEQTRPETGKNETEPDETGYQTKTEAPRGGLQL